MSGRFFRSVSDSEDSSSSSSDEELMSDSDDEQQQPKKAAASAAPAKKSTFLKSSAADSDDSDSSDSDDSDEDSDEESDEDASDDDKKKKAAPAAAAAPKVSRFMRGAASDDSDSDSDGDEVKKVIRSAKDKRMDEVDGVVKTIENAQRIDDWVAISKGECRTRRRLPFTRALIRSHMLTHTHTTHPPSHLQNMTRCSASTTAKRT